MEYWIQMVITVVASVLASSGFWAFIQNRHNKTNAERQMLVGLAHDRIVYLGLTYIERGYITKDEYENLHKYLFTPYKALGGNGSASRVMSEVDRLPIKSVAMKKGESDGTE